MLPTNPNGEHPLWPFYYYNRDTLTSISTFLYQNHVHFLFPLLALTIGPEPKDTTKYQIPKNPDARETSRPLLFAAERFRHPIKP
jgi:hypothetical protein